MPGSCPAGQHDWVQQDNGTYKCGTCGAFSSRNYGVSTSRVSGGLWSAQSGRHAPGP